MTTKVYILSARAPWYEHFSIIGVYSSEELAIAWREQHKLTHKDYQYDIEEYGVIDWGTK